MDSSTLFPFHFHLKIVGTTSWAFAWGNQYQTTPRQTTSTSCQFTSNSGGYNVMVCKDGSSWDIAFYGWDCCSSHQGRAQCPSNIPIMCADLSCNGDHCCDNAGTTACNTMGGARLCSKLLALYTYKSSGDAYIYIWCKL